MIFNQINHFFLPRPVIAQGTAWADMTNKSCVVGDVATIGGIECLFENFLKIITPLAGLVFFGMFITGGFKYLTAGGDPKKMASASHTITLSFIAIIGIIIAWLILLLIKNFTGVNVTEFKISS